MIYLIIGHRGVGKTSWLNKLKLVFTDSDEIAYKNKKKYFIDLDKEIEKETGQKINDLLISNKNQNKIQLYRNTLGKTFHQPAFSIEENNKYFRLIEQETLSKLIKKYKNTKDLVFIALGAGAQHIFQEKIPSFCHIIHLARETDSQGRVFLDRPRLIPHQKPYEEYMSLYHERDYFYKKIKTESFVLPEGDMAFNEGEKFLFQSKGFCLVNYPGFFNCIITLNKNTLPLHKKQWPSFISKRLSWGVRFFELRDDQLNSDDLHFLLKIIPKEKKLLSFRLEKKSIFLKQDLFSLTWDWPLEKGPPPTNLFLASLKGKKESGQIPSPPILSLHNREQKESLSLVLKKMTTYKADHFKLAVPIRNFKELMQGHLWFLKDPEHRSFLPVSEKGEVGLWRWYRQIFGPQMKLHFIRESHGEVLDQPFLYEHLLFLHAISNRLETRPLKKNFSLPFAAVLGDPVIHSASPAFHRQFFSKKRMIFTKITIDEKDFTKENLSILQKMGLIFAAVTSPLKKKAFQICDEIDSSAQQLQSVNTLIFKYNKWFGSNTDQYGLQALLNSVKKRKLIIPKTKAINTRNIAVWGGGGVKKILEKELPNAFFYSARTGKKSFSNLSNKTKQIQKKEEINPYIVVWAVGRNRMPTSVLPPPSWKPRWVIDLNYTENSPGKEYALLAGAKYISGVTMFKHQAKKQQELFAKIFSRF